MVVYYIYNYLSYVSLQVFYYKQLFIVYFLYITLLCITIELVINRRKLHNPTILPLGGRLSQPRISLSNDHQYLLCTIPIETLHNLIFSTSTHFVNMFSGFFDPLSSPNTSPSSTNLRVKWYRLLMCFVFDRPGSSPTV